MPLGGVATLIIANIKTLASRKYGISRFLNMGTRNLWIVRLSQKKPAICCMDIFQPCMDLRWWQVTPEHCWDLGIRVHQDRSESDNSIDAISGSPSRYSTWEQFASSRPTYSCDIVSKKMFPWTAKGDVQNKAYGHMDYTIQALALTPNPVKSAMSSTKPRETLQISKRNTT